MAQHTLRRRWLTATPTNWPVNVSPLMQRIYATRGIIDPEDIEKRLAKILTPALLGGIPRAVEIMIDAILTNKRITVSGDYDCDGATGSAVAVRGLRMLGSKNVGFIVPNRFEHGYGLSPALVDAMDPKPDVIVTVDSGVSSVEGVKHAKDRGIIVVVTDHHLPGDTLPDADAIVNPNLNGDAFPSKMLAGVGVMFYLLLAIRSKMNTLGLWDSDNIPDLAKLLDLVALGTIADLVPLDRNNRILVDAGLRRIRAGKACVGIRKLLEISNKDPETLIASDIAFSAAPRLNAAGRLENMSLGVQALITDDPGHAKAFVTQLDNINKERREMQADMVAQAEAMVADMDDLGQVGIVVFNPKWHAGIVGLVASKIKENLHRPVFAFAPADKGSDEVRGSGRSIPGFHLRDALVAVDSQCPGLIPKFGGHAMAAGLSLKAIDVERFAEVFDDVATQMIGKDALEAIVYTDGELDIGQLSLDTARMIREAGPWGQGFPEPIFDNVFECVSWRKLGDKHLKFALRDSRDGTLVQAVMFGVYDGSVLPTRIRAAYELNINVWHGRESLQLLIRHMEPA